MSKPRTNRTGKSKAEHEAQARLAAEADVFVRWTGPLPAKNRRASKRKVSPLKRLENASKHLRVQKTLNSALNRTQKNTKERKPYFPSVDVRNRNGDFSGREKSPESFFLGLFLVVLGSERRLQCLELADKPLCFFRILCLSAILFCKVYRRRLWRSSVFPLSASRPDTFFRPSCYLT